jgi:hypothetical protein
MTDEGGKDQYASQQHIRQEDEDGGFAMMNMNNKKRAGTEIRRK